MSPRRCLHLVYPHQRVGSTPDVIGWKVADALSATYDVRAYDWDETIKIVPRAGDLLLGHPHPLPFTVLRRSWSDDKWAKRILLAPYSGDLASVAFEDRLVRSADAFLAITGPPWVEAAPFSPLAHWAPKIRQMDLAVDPNDYPRVKSDFSQAGSRSFLYVGNTSDAKSPEYLEAIAATMPGVTFGWIGPAGGRPLTGYLAHGRIPTDGDAARRIAARYDFLLVASRADANPTVVLEAMSWGLIPVTTATAGYRARDGVVELPLHDVAAANEVLASLQQAPASYLHTLRARNDELLRSRYTWTAFTQKVQQELARAVPARAAPEPSRRSGLVRYAEVTSHLTRDRGLWTGFAHQLLNRRPATRPVWR